LRVSIFWKTFQIPTHIFRISLCKVKLHPKSMSDVINWQGNQITYVVLLNVTLISEQKVKFPVYYTTTLIFSATAILILCIGLDTHCLGRHYLHIKSKKKS
jgi:hypothetical protein